MKKRVYMLAALLLLSLVLAGCSSTVGEHTSTFFNQAGSVLSTAANSSRLIAEAEANVAAEEEEEADPNALSKPADFTVSEDGDFSFDAVEGAALYNVGIYSDSKTKEADYTMQIDDDGSSVYTGTIDDILAANATVDFMGNPQEAEPLKYGTWSIRVCAVPDYETSDRTASPEAKDSYVVSGPVDYGDIEFGSMWDTFSEELTVKISGMDCSSTMYPTDVIVTLTNEADASDVVTVDVIDIDSDTVEAVTSDVEPDAEYEVSAEFQWDPEYVTNPEYTAPNTGVAETSSENNLLTGDFYYIDAIYNNFGFPHVQMDFDLEKGGLAGVWYKDPNAASADPFMMMMGGGDTADEDEDGNAYFEAIPKAAENGAKYSYDIEITSPAGKIYATPYTDSGQGSTIIWGTLDLFDDGTFTMELEYQYILTDTISSGVYYIPGAICTGKYTDNGDGTVNLSYDHTNSYESDYTVVTELTGKAAEYAKDHPDFEQKFENPFGGETP